MPDVLSLPGLICNNCSILIKTCFAFKTKCEENEQMLLEIINVPLPTEASCSIRIKEETFDEMNISPSTFQIKEEILDNDLNELSVDPLFIPDMNGEPEPLLLVYYPSAEKSSTVNLSNSGDENNMKPNEVAKEGLSKCELCDARFHYEKSLNRHKKEIHKNIIERKVPKKRCIENEIQEPKDLKCEICGYEYQYEWSLKRHERAMHGCIQTINKNIIKNSTVHCYSKKKKRLD